MSGVMEAKVDISFNRELPSIFGRIESTSSGGHLVSTYPLPLIKLREHFNAPYNQSGIKQRIILELDYIVNSVLVNTSLIILEPPFLLCLHKISY